MFLLHTNFLKIYLKRIVLQYCKDKISPPSKKYLRHSLLYSFFSAKKLADEPSTHKAMPSFVLAFLHSSDWRSHHNSL